MPPPEINRFVAVEIKHWAAVVAKAGLKLE